MPSLEDPRFLAMEGEIVDPFDSLDAMIKHEDLQKFVLFKTHYRKYMDVSVAYEDVMSRLESYEDELDHAKSQEMKALEDLETMRTLLREKDVILQKKEDELFAADEKITQLECDLDEERTRGLKLKSDLASLVEEKQSLVKQCQTALREKNDVQLRFQVEKSKCSEDEAVRSSEQLRLAAAVEELAKDRERWRLKWEDLYSKVKALEAQWRENRELQGLVKAGMTHLAQCSKPSMCKMCSRVRESSFKNGLSVANGSATHKEASSVTDSRRRQASLLRGQYQRLCHVIGTLLPAPMATFDPGLDEPLGDDSGFVDEDDDHSAGVHSNGGCHNGGSPAFFPLRRQKSFDGVHGVKTSVGNGTTLGLSTSSPDTPKNGALANKRSAFLRMSRLTKSFGHSEKDKFRDPAAVVRRQLTIEDALEEAEVEPPIHDLAKHKKRSVRSFFNRMSIRLKHRGVLA